MNPFKTGEPVAGNDFIGREEETAHLVENFSGHLNTAVLSSRGWGKTSLVQRATETLRNMRREIISVYVNVLPFKNRGTFYAFYSRCLIQAIAASADEAYKYEMAFLENGSADESVLDLPQKIAMDKMVHILVCIDEFQQFADFREAESFLRALRAHWQHHTRVFYCICASQVSRIKALFEEAGKPFFKFAETLILSRIDRAQMVRHIAGRFSETGKAISEENCLKIWELTDGHPAYAMQLSREAWLRTERECTGETVRTAFEAMLQAARLSCAKLFETLTDKQVSFLQAVYDGVKTFYATETFRRYDLGTIGNIRKMKDALEKKGVLNIAEFISFQDPVFKRYFAELSA